MNYVYSWFFVDLFSVVPFDAIFNSGHFNKITRFSRIGKISRLIRLSKIMRIMKVARLNSNMAKSLGDNLKISANAERLMLLLLTFFTMLHVIACTWYI
jgi:hypothetical protein